MTTTATMSRKRTTSPRKRLSGKAIATVRERMGLSVADFAAALGVSLASAYRWEATSWPKLRPTPAALVTALAAMSDDALKTLGQEITHAIAGGGPFGASRLVLDAVAPRE